MPPELDAKDRRLLRQLQRDARQPLADLAEEVGLSTSACHRRLQALRQVGLIVRETVVIDGKALGYGLEFFVTVQLDSQAGAALRAFEEGVARLPEVLECTLMTGAMDYWLRVAVRDAEHYERLHQDGIATLPHVARLESHLALRTVKPWSGYPL